MSAQIQDATAEAELTPKAVADGAVTTIPDATGAKSPFAAGDLFAGAATPDITQHITNYCTFTRCELSPDGSFAKILVSIWGDEKEQERIMKDIKRHVHGMRQSIAKHIRMRTIPQLAFVQDHSFERGAHVEKLIT